MVQTMQINQTIHPKLWEGGLGSNGWMEGPRRDFAVISPRFRRDFAEISPRFRRDFAEISPRFRRDFAETRFRRDFANILQTLLTI
jgi:hypothetical protein